MKSVFSTLLISVGFFSISQSVSAQDGIETVDFMKRSAGTSDFTILYQMEQRTKDNRWQADLTAHWYSSMQLPNTQSNPEQYRKPIRSYPYTTVNAQGTFRSLRPFL